MCALVPNSPHYSMGTLVCFIPSKFVQYISLNRSFSFLIVMSVNAFSIPEKGSGSIATRLLFSWPHYVLIQYGL